MPKFYPRFALANQMKYLWLNVEPFETGQLDAVARNKTWNKTKVGEEMSFAIVESWDERIAHTWEKFDSMTSKVLEKVVSVGSALTQLHGAVKGQESGLAAKVDEAMIYKDSPRRAMTFSLNLAAFDSPEEEVIKPIKELQKYSCASANNDDVLAIDWPYIFSISISDVTGTNVLLKMEEAALTNVDVTYKMPFMMENGKVLPGVATLVVTFIELNPLYQGNFVD